MEQQPEFANQRQVAGDHYQNGGHGVQHWDWITANLGASYLIGCATKYVARYKKKNGSTDLTKADHYVEKMLELVRDSAEVYANSVGKEQTVGIKASGYDGSEPWMRVSVDEFAAANGLDDVQTQLCKLIMHYDEKTLIKAREILAVLILQVIDEEA